MCRMQLRLLFDLGLRGHDHFPHAVWATSPDAPGWLEGTPPPRTSQTVLSVSPFLLSAIVLTSNFGTRATTVLVTITSTHPKAYIAIDGKDGHEMHPN